MMPPASLRTRRTSFTVEFGTGREPEARRVLNRLEKLARSTDRFTGVCREATSYTWLFTGPADAIVAALHGLAVNEGQHTWKLSTSVEWS